MRIEDSQPYKEMNAPPVEQHAGAAQLARKASLARAMSHIAANALQAAPQKKEAATARSVSFNDYAALYKKIQQLQNYHGPEQFMGVQTLCPGSTPSMKHIVDRGISRGSLYAFCQKFQLDINDVKRTLKQNEHIFQAAQKLEARKEVMAASLRVGNKVNAKRAEEAAQLGDKVIVLQGGGKKERLLFAQAHSGEAINIRKHTFKKVATESLKPFMQHAKRTCLAQHVSLLKASPEGLSSQ